MTPKELQEKVYKLIAQDRHVPITFVSIHSTLEVDERKVDRALQTLRKAGRIRFVKATKHMTHGWLAAGPRRHVPDVRPRLPYGAVDGEALLLRRRRPT